MANFLVHLYSIFSYRLHLLMDVDLVLKLDIDRADFTDFDLFICVHLYNLCLIVEVASTLELLGRLQSHLNS